MYSQHTYKTIPISSQISLENIPVFHSDSSGKEKDAETGYHYFGARYYNSDLSLWLSVDPMSDKYPSLSPYNYCVWNPMKLVDPNGDTCKFATKEDEAYVKQLIDKNSKVYSQAFAEKYEKLDASSHNYLFESWDYDESRSESGLFSPNTSKNTSTIKFTKGETPETRNPIYGASEFRNLFEETFHAWKFETNNHINVPSCLSEAMAWQFSALAPGTNLINYNNKDLTLMGHILYSPVETIALEFKVGFGNNKYSDKVLYPNLPLTPNNRFRKNMGMPIWK